MAACAPLSPAMADVIDERRRQVAVEGWTPEHDDAHPEGSIARAAACYAVPSVFREMRMRSGGNLVGDLWPWEWAWWKPKSRRADLVRAGALIIAEIERLDRATTREEARAVS